MFVDYKLNKSLHIINLGTEGTAKVYLLTIGEEKKTYRYLEWVWLFIAQSAFIVLEQSQIRTNLINSES